MSKHHPTVDSDETVEVSRAASLSLNYPYVTTMTVKEALAGGWFDTSRGTMSVHVTVKTGPHSGATAYLSGSAVRAAYDPIIETAAGNPLE